LDNLCVLIKVQCW